MRKSAFIFCLLTASLQIFSQQSGWVWQNPLPQGNDATDIKMFNSGTGYCRTDYSILKTTNFGTNWVIIFNDEYVGDIYFINEQTGYYSKGSQLYKTVNGGSNWNLHHTYSGDFSPGQMTWLNEMTGFTIYSSPLNSTPYYGTRIRKTTNGGTLWQQVFNDTTISINSISMPSASTGYIAGATANEPSRNAKFFKSANNGLNWDSITINNLRGLKAVDFINDLTGYLTGSRVFANGPNLLRTTNGGITWDSVFFGMTSTYTKLEFINFNTGYGYNGSLRKTTNAGLNWVLLDHYSAGLSIRDFSLYSGENLYVCGYKGQVGKSTNAGLNWIADSKGFYGYLYSIRFFDANTGLATGNNLEGIYLRTTNGGLTWDTNSVSGYYLEQINIVNSNTAYIAGQGKILKTTNKGASFTVYPTYSGSGWSDVSFPNENTGYCVYKYRVIDKTTDGGNTWTNISPFSGGEYFTICFINGNTGFFGGSKMFKTTNGGQFWDTVIAGLTTSYFCNKIRYINGKLYSIGYTYPPNQGIIMTSTNEGISWQIDSIPNENFYDISIPSPNLIYLIGSRNYIYKSFNNSPWIKYNTYTTGGYSPSICFVNNDTGFISTYDGGILKTTNGGGEPIGINPQSNEIPTAFSLYQNYPNPFNPTTIIEYSLPKNSLVTIKIYDLLGRLVKQIVNENQSAGNYSVNFDGSSYASGVYFYTIETPEFIQSKKMVLVK